MLGPARLYRREAQTTGPGVNPLWARAPLALRHYPGLLVAVAAGSLLLAAAAASAPLYLSATAGSALRQKLAGVTAYGAGLELKQSEYLFPANMRPPGEPRHPSIRERGRAAQSVLAGAPHLGPEIATISGQPLYVAASGTPETSRQVRLLARTGALAHVDKLTSGGSGRGAWISDAWAKELDVGPGDTIVLRNHVSYSQRPRTARVRIAGVYRALYQEPQTPYWRNLYEQIYPPSAALPPPPTFLIASPETVLGLIRRLEAWQVDLRWEFPLDMRDRLTLPEAKRVAAGLARAERVLGTAATPTARRFGCQLGGCETLTVLPTAIGAAEQQVSALRGPADLLTAAGGLVALAVVAAAGAFLVARRRTEAALLHARGWSPVGFAGKAALETALPATIGTAAGFGLAVGVVAAFGPGGPVDPAALGDAARAAAYRLPIALGVLAVVAGAVFAGLTGVGRRRIGILRLPWELAALAVAAFCFERLGSGHALVQEAGGVERPSAYVLLFPIFLVAGLAGLAARLWGPALRVSRRRSEGLSPGPYLAVHRLASAERLAVLLVTACALSLGIFVYAQTVVRSIEDSVVVKSRLFVGSDVEGVVNLNQRLPGDLGFPATKVTKVIRGGELSEQGAQLDLLAVDPRTLAGAVYWEGSWSDADIDEIARRLAAPSGRAVPVAVAGGALPDPHRIWVDGKPIPVRVVANASAFPGMSEGRPLVVGAYRAWEGAFRRAGTVDQLLQAEAETQVWAKGAEKPVVAALAASSARPFQVLTASEIRDNPSIVAATRTFAFLKTLGFAAGLLAVVGLLLYLQARQRSRALSEALSRRMGLRARSRFAALGLEVGTMLASSLAIGALLALAGAHVVLGDVDPLANIPPAPIFRTPVAVLAGSVVALAAVSLLGALAASWVAGRANLAEVMRAAE